MRAYIMNHASWRLSLRTQRSFALTVIRCFTTNVGDAPPSGDREQRYQGKRNRSDSENNSSSSQFDQQRQAYRKHSFQGKPASSASTSPQDRRSLASHWENAFFGRVHYEEGMHQRYAEAVAEDENEKPNLSDSYKGDSSVADQLSSWPEDSNVPDYLFFGQPAAEKLKFIIDRLSRGERRVKFAPDYGGLTMMAQLSLGEQMIREAEKRLNDMEWMTSDLQAKITEVKEAAAKIKYDFDID